MMSRLLTYVLLVTFIGCESKEYKKEQNSNIDVVSELNHGESQVVIEKLQTKSNLTPRERSYLASALSQKGGIDVFSLYSVLEIQLFRKNALEWSDLSKDKNPYLKFLKSQDNVDEKARKKKRAERWAKYGPKIIERNALFLDKPSYENAKEPYSTMTIEDYEAIDVSFKAKYDEIMKGALDEEMRSKKWDEFIDGHFDEGNIKPYNYKLANHYSDLIYYESVKESYLNPEKRASGLENSVGWELLYMNILWNSYESISVMKQMPTLATGQQESISASLREYKKLLNDGEFGKVAIKNIMVLTGVSLLSIYKNSFSLDEITSLEDMMCTFEPGTLIENYGLIRERVIFLAEVVDEAVEIEEIKKFKGRIDELKEMLPIELNDEQKANYEKSIENFKIDRCFNG